jgi:signal transduction histidine kinase
MRWPQSLKGQFVLGSVLWTLGLLGASHLAFVYVTQYVPHILVIQHWTVLGVLAVVFMLGGLTQVRRGLSPVNQLRSRLSAVRHGASARVDGDYPGEVQPLVDDLNALLEHREVAVRQAQQQAADLAHVLKTPLAVLAQDAADVERASLGPVAASMRHEVGRMQRHIDYHLAQARSAASAATPGTRCAVAASVEPLVRTMQRLHADRGLTMEVRVGEHAVAVEREDLDEMLGNLIDNACKWARTSVSVHAVRQAAMVQIAVADDGPGLSADERRAVLERGVRADESKPGAGLGLPIARALAHRYGGTLMLEPASGDRGLQATLLLPSA